MLYDIIHYIPLLHSKSDIVHFTTGRVHFVSLYMKCDMRRITYYNVNILQNANKTEYRNTHFSEICIKHPI